MKELTKFEFDLLAELADKRVNYSKDYPSELVDNAKKELIECVSTNTSERISPILVKKLRYKYNEDFIPGLIGSRVYLAVMDYVLSVNIGSSDKK